MQNEMLKNIRLNGIFYGENNVSELSRLLTWTLIVVK